GRALKPSIYRDRSPSYPQANRDHSRHGMEHRRNKTRHDDGVTPTERIARRCLLRNNLHCHAPARAPGYLEQQLSILLLTTVEVPLIPNIVQENGSFPSPLAPAW